MRSDLLVALVAFTLTGCTFDATGLSAESSGAADSTTGDSTGPNTETTVDPTTGDSSTTIDPASCGNSQQDPGEECDNGELNNGKNGSICKGDCTSNFCGDGYVASNEGCDDGNMVDGDDCRNDCTSPGCGDGTKVDGEECDDGNMVNDDECSNLCKLPFCGDGNVGAGEECDDGVDNNDEKKCTTGCKMAACGDGFVQKGVEACDDGNDVDDDMCSNACVSQDCGDGKVDPGEMCDDGNEDETDACTNLCVPASCGDGHVQKDVEECDMGPANGNDQMCTLACKTAICGDGFVQMDVEECDDDNDVNDDACTNACQMAECGDDIVQMGEQCDGGLGCTNCVLDCGNGMKDAGEECDDGNQTANDTCTECKRTGYRVFVTSMKYKGGAIGTLMEADGLCNTLAKDKLPGTYKAWLSNSMDDAASRLAKVDLPYFRPDDKKVANNWTDLTTKSLLMPISVTENKSTVTGGDCMDMATDGRVWTNTVQLGTPKGGDHCMDWTTSAKQSDGAVGLATVINPGWTDSCKIPCDQVAHLYCFEQP